MSAYFREIARELRELSEPLPADPLARRDAEFIRRHQNVLGPLVERWFAPEYEGFAHVPRGRALVVGTHNGGIIGPDMFCFMVGAWRALGPEQPIYGLAHDVGFRLPLIASWLSRIGGVPARAAIARELLERDVPVVVYPGGDRDAYKPYKDRHVVNFFGRMGFVRTAIQAGAPIVPMISVGAHEALYVISDGAWVARALNLDTSLRIKILPLQLSVPWGLSVGPVPNVPIPSKVRIRILPAIDLGLPRAAAADGLQRNRTRAPRGYIRSTCLE